MRIPVPQFLNRQFIFPTNLGGYLNGLIFLLTLLAFGYNNNLLLIFTLILFGMNLIWVIQSHLFFKKMKFLEITVSDVFLGEPSEVRIRWENPGFMGQWELELYQGKKRFPVKVTDSSKREIRGEVVLPYRGKFSFSTLRIASPSPFGLYRNWIILPVKAQGYVYPALRKNFKSSWVSPTPLETGGEKNFDTYQEFAEFRSAEGALTSRISWKHYAQTGELLVKFGEGTRGEIRRLQLKDHLQGEEREKMLSELASEAHWCFQQGLQFELLIRSQSFGPGSGAALTRSVLRELALC